MMNKKLTREEWIKKAIKIHGNKYNYNKVVYKNNRTKVLIICPEHGEFWQEPVNHVRTLSHGCRKCADEENAENNRMTKEEFVERANKVHNNFYSYKDSIYINFKSNLKIVCPEHGEFWQAPKNHLYDHGCRLCGINKFINTQKINKRLTKEQFINKANKVHKFRYVYNKTEYINHSTKIIITCRKHGDFLQRPDNHTHNHGCQKCNRSRGEIEIENYLLENNINFIPQQKFNDCVGIKNKLSFDFYLPDYSTCIEFDGRMHFEPMSNSNIGLKSFEDTKRNDIIKNKYCVDKGVNLIRIPYKDISKIGEILNEKLLIKKVA
jgi:hypothetical protein